MSPLPSEKKLICWHISIFLDKILVGIKERTFLRQGIKYWKNCQDRNFILLYKDKLLIIWWICTTCNMQDTNYENVEVLKSKQCFRGYDITFEASLLDDNDAVEIFEAKVAQSSIWSTPIKIESVRIKPTFDPSIDEWNIYRNNIKIQLDISSWQCQICFRV